jgi:hypothetical protein
MKIEKQHLLLIIDDKIKSMEKILYVNNSDLVDSPYEAGKLDGAIEILAALKIVIYGLGNGN